jgi:maltose alpha-D-glucosyltransferase/alpha-amylase
MVTPEERMWMWNHYCYVPEAKQNMGIRLRLARLMDGSYRKQHLMNTMLFTMPGTPVIYYGDEIGMGDNVYLNDRDGVRTPMQWTPETNAGFSHANPQRLYLPVINDPEFHYETVNVQVQEKRSRSMLQWMRRMIDVRKQYKCFGRGELIMLEPENRSILAYIRKFHNEVVLVVCNLSGKPASISLDLSDYDGYETTEILSATPFHDVEPSYRLTITGWGTYLLELSKKLSEHHQ